MRRLVLFILALAVIALGLSFAMLNAGDAQVNYYFGTATMPLSLWLAVTLLGGAVLGAVSTTALIVRQRRELARLRREAKQARTEVDELRKLPLRDNP
ncbi:Lipopolysaccharide assembly protein A [wastewater metagenome]|uniref:Lipopolysaccharide assembly protein A n=2 Tax=unclassified sequences TaxID=12908 RepID=A0A5B8RGT0_9ZZZZ|nr:MULTISPECIES: LapA family protein [Arhodomonas]MCS4505043.1 LapA family protein [Arhodomonas aquaeolei]QEA06065.1 lipopolysaccharide assembly protein A [uncultured organism]